MSEGNAQPPSVAAMNAAVIAEFRRTAERSAAYSPRLR